MYRNASDFCDYSFLNKCLYYKEILEIGKKEKFKKERAKGDIHSPPDSQPQTNKTLFSVFFSVCFKKNVLI